LLLKSLEALCHQLSELKKEQVAINDPKGEKSLNAGGGLMYCYKDFREQYKDRVDDLELAIRAIHEQFCVVVEQVVEHTEDIASIKERLAVLEIENKMKQRR